MSRHSFFLGQKGGGGSGDFAYIKIEYPERQIVEVEFNGETTEAPDTTGLWMYGCDEIGTYTIKIQGTDISKSIEITEQGQIEIVWISPQVINYGLIYYLGNEFAEPTEDEKKYAIKTGGWTANNKVITSSWSRYSAGYKTLININTNGYSKFFSYDRFQQVGRDISGLYSAGTDYTNNTGVGVVLQNNQTCYFSLNGPNDLKKFSIDSLSNFNDTITISETYILYFSETGPSNSNSKGNNYLYSKSIYGTEYVSRYTFAAALLKTDDISILSDYGSTISEILNNATDLFDDISALNKMVLNCTGDFMISALSNTNFINAMNLSSNKSILIANEHWNRFIALLSI